MPFKNKQQMKACYAQNNPKWDCSKWSKETKDLKSLPQGPKKSLLKAGRKK